MIKNDETIEIHDWMIKELGLSEESLIAYAVVYTHTQENGQYTGSLNNIAKWCGTTVSDIAPIIWNLECRGFLIGTGNVLKAVREVPAADVFSKRCD